MNVWKPIVQVVWPPKIVYKYILDQNKGYWSHMELIHFWNFFCLFQDVQKVNIIPNSFTTCKNCLINAWKPIYLVAILPRSVSIFFRSERGLIKPHGTKSLFKWFCGFYRVIFYTGIFTGLHNPKRRQFSVIFFYYFFFIIFLIKQAEHKICRKFLWKVSSQWLLGKKICLKTRLNLNIAKSLAKKFKQLLIFLQIFPVSEGHFVRWKC